MNGESTIRPAEPGDVEAIARVHLQCWAETYRGLMPDVLIDQMTPERRTKAWRQIMEQPRPPLIIHVVEHTAHGITGFISAGPAREPSHGFSHEITSIYVLRRVQGQGVGRALLRRAVTDVRQQAGDGLYAWVLESNPARGFYSHLGGAVITSKTQVRGEHELSEVMYGWPKLPAP